MLTSLLALALQTSPLLEEDVITVTGRVGVTDTPVSVTRLDAETLAETQAIVTLGDALSLVPGVQIVRTGPLGNQASVFIRGTDSDHVLSTYDGIRLNSPATPNGAYGFGSDLLAGGTDVEVLRGPASATYGSDAIGGVVNLTPAREEGGAVLGLIGELDTYQGTAFTAGEAGRLRYGFGAAYAETAGWSAVPGRIVAEEKRGERDGSEAHALNADLSYALAEDWSLDLTALRREAEAEFDAFSGGPTGFQRADDDDLRSTDELSVLRIGVTHAPTDALSLTLQAGGVDADFEERNGDAVTGEVHGERRFVEGLARYEGGTLTVSGGVTFEREEADVPVSFSDPLSEEEDHLGAFVFVQSDVSERLILSGALRVDDYEGFGVPVTWNAGARFALSERWSVRGSLGTAYNIPSLAERYTTSAFAAPNPDLQEETAFSAEAAILREQPVGGGTARFEAVLFRTDTDDLIEYDFASLQNVNVGDARAQGLELSAGWAGPRFTGRIAYTYTDAENRDTNEALLRRPEHALSAVADLVVTDRLSLSARYVRTGERPDVTYDDAGFYLGNDEVAGFDEVALTGRYALTETLTGFVSVTNLLGETYEQPAGFGSAPRLLKAGLQAGW